MDTFLRYIQVRAFGRGLRGYHSAWVVVGVAIWMINRARNADDVIYRTKLKPGERLWSRPASPPPSAAAADRPVGGHRRHEMTARGTGAERTGASSRRASGSC